MEKNVYAALTIGAHLEKFTTQNILYVMMRNDES